MTDPDLAECWNELRPAPPAPAAHQRIAKEVAAKLAQLPLPTEPTTVPRTLRETDRLMHVLWTKAVGTPGYNKAEWKALEAAIWALIPGGTPPDIEGLVRRF